MNGWEERKNIQKPADYHLEGEIIMLPFLGREDVGNVEGDICAHMNVLGAILCRELLQFVYMNRIPKKKVLSF